MNYQALYNFFRDLSQNLDLTTKFFHGRKEWLNYTDPDKPLYIYSLPFTSSGTFTSGVYQSNEIWTTDLIFYMQDQGDTAVDQNNQDEIQDEIKILTITENAANRFLHFANENDLTPELSEAADRLQITSFNKTTAIKDTAQLLTGTILTLNLIVPQSFDYCCE